MKKLLMSMVIFSLAMIPMACNESPKGGVVTTNRESTETRETFTIKAPSGHTTIRQGEKQIVKISLDRSPNFKQDVKIEVTDEKGLKIDPMTTKVLAADNAEVSMTVEADKDAAIGDHIFKITGTPVTKGASTSVEVKIKVEEAKK